MASNDIRDPMTGQFIPGHKYLPPNSAGTPVAHRMSQLRTMAVKAQSSEDVIAIFTALLKKGKDGDVPACKVYLDFVIGRPIQKLELTGADGEPLGLQLGNLAAAIFQDLLEYPQARTIVAMTIQRVTGDVYRNAHHDNNTGEIEPDSMDGGAAGNDDELRFDS